MYAMPTPSVRGIYRTFLSDPRSNPTTLTACIARVHEVCAVCWTVQIGKLYKFSQ